jgi:hypothetical protein
MALVAFTAPSVTARRICNYALADIRDAERKGGI